MKGKARAYASIGKCRMVFKKLCFYKNTVSSMVLKDKDRTLISAELV